MKSVIAHKIYGVSKKGAAMINLMLECGHIENRVISSVYSLIPKKVKCKQCNIGY